MSPHSIGFLITLILSIFIVVLVDRLLRPGLRGLLEEIVALPPATEFYLRAFITVIILVGVANVIDSYSDLKDGARFMEYAWAVADRLKHVFEALIIILLVYVGLITVLTAALRRRQ